LVLPLADNARARGCAKEPFLFSSLPGRGFSRKAAQAAVAATLDLTRQFFALVKLCTSLLLLGSCF